jgi:type IV secretion system protein VirD4
MQEVQRPLLTPDECLRMPGPQKDHHDMITAPGDMVVYCAGYVIGDVHAERHAVIC